MSIDELHVGQRVIYQEQAAIVTAVDIVDERVGLTVFDESGGVRPIHANPGDLSPVETA